MSSNFRAALRICTHNLVGVGGTKACHRV